MVWDFGAGDVVAGIRLALAVYQVSCVYENRADVRYRNFVNEIHGFRELLIKLQTSLKDAGTRYERGGLLSRAAYDPSSRDFREEGRQIIGPFNETLLECQLLLENNKRLQSKQSSLYDNITWHLSEQDQKIDDLRRRLHMHSTKIKLVIDRLSINLLTDIDAKVDDLLDISERNFNLNRDIQIEIRRFYTSWLGVLAGHEPLSALSDKDCHVASDQIQARFEQMLPIYAPASIDIDIPLKEGFDALLIHFEQSFEGTDQTPEKYLLLLKTRWLLNRLKTSTGYQKACPGFFYKRAIGQVEQAILLRVRGSDIIAYDDETLNGLADAIFLIWEPPQQEESLQLDPTTARANEQEVIRLQLASSSIQSPDSVTVFRQSIDRFRIVLETTTPDGRAMILPQTLYTQEDKLIPRYALPTMMQPCMEIAIFSRKEETLYRFKSPTDIFAFQTALTGYEVSHDQSNIKCQFSKDSAGQLDCKGRVQLWQEPIPPPNVLDSSTNGSPIESFSTQSARSRQSSIVESIGPTTTLSKVGDGFEADNLKLPALTIFTELKDKAGQKRFSIMFIELDIGFSIDPKKCSCHRAYNECPYICLVRRRDEEFPIHVSFTELDPSGSPNPNSFDVLPFRLPRDSKFKELMVKKTKYVVLKFPTLAEKHTFRTELLQRFWILGKQKSDREAMWKTLRHRQNTPMVNYAANGVPIKASQSASSASYSRISSSPPQIMMPEMNTRFSVSLGFESEPGKPVVPLPSGSLETAGFTDEKEVLITPAPQMSSRKPSRVPDKELESHFESSNTRGGNSRNSSFAMPIRQARSRTLSTQSSIREEPKQPSSTKRFLKNILK
ncbi:hypothetical protein B0A52_08140 [Exophiala mesophila]|uniref:Uncharacterized protein n=1 Tax=Exophiala mesophila TaxID=212818 RepID=A0A438MV21_EXOME|nr:hypothetical protein B0A52_08140 [Exophiala mesophila]